MTRKTVAALVVLLVACGKRGDPRPPVPVIPQATSDLAVTQRADHVILSWSYPSLTTAGRSLTDIRRISVYRYVEELPVSAVGENAPMQPAEPSVPQPVALFAKVPTLPKAQFEKLATRVDSIEKASLGSATTGARLFYTDTPPMRATDGRPVRVTYAVVTESASARSEASNLAILVPLAVGVAPDSLTATAKPEGIVLSWKEPKASIGDAGAPIISGYYIYRSVPGEALNEQSVPIDKTPVKGTTYTDVPAYGEHEYRVTAVASTEPSVVQSDASLPARATFRDLVAPPAPASITALLETKVVRLIWDAVDAPDLAGYHVYRTEGVGHEDIKPIGTVLLVNPILTATTISDEHANLGIAYRYGVSAIDKSGNESAKVWTDWVVAPKTP
jgi:hypothetical protein